MLDLQSQFDFDDTKERCNGPVALHNRVNVQLPIRFEGVVQLLEFLVLYDLKLDLLEFLKTKLLNQMFSSDTQINCE